MSIQIEDLFTPPTADEIKESIYNTLARLGTRTSGWKPGGVVRTIIAIVATILAAGFSLISDVAKQYFLEFAEGDWLTIIARHVYGVERIAATFASGQVTLTNSGGGEYGPFAPGEFTCAAPSLTNGGKTYTNVSTFTLNSLETLAIDVIANESGSDSSAGIGTITTLVTSMVGVTCSNTLALVGNDAESDPNLKLRCREKQASISPMGPADAYAYAARSALRPNGSSVGVTRVRVPTPPGNGTLSVVVASASGSLASEDLGYVQTAILANATPIGATPTAVNASVKVQNVTCDIWIYTSSGKTASELYQDVEDSITEMLSNQPIGGNPGDDGNGYVYVDHLRDALFCNDKIYRISLATPSADVLLNSNEVPTLGSLTMVSHFVSDRGL
jgi:phage-related baseplate assembly protein